MVGSHGTGPKWLSRLRDRSDSEHEQATIRLVLGLVACLYLLFVRLGGADGAGGSLIVWLAAGFMSASLLLFIGILVWPAPSPLRRAAGIFLDLSTTSLAMGISGEHGAPLLAVYLWVIIGNGFRFGLPYLALATAVAVLGFGGVILQSPYWQEHSYYSASMLLVLLLIPAYMAALLRKLTQAIRRANEASRAKSQFLAKMSHELRTPLNGVIGMSDLLMDSDLNREQQSFARTIQSSATTLLGIIENILDFSKIEAGRITLESVEMDLHHLLSDTVKMFRPQAQRKGLTLNLHIDPQVPFLLHGDPLHLRQVITNLLSNAIKFTRSGRVDLRARLAQPERTGARCQLRFEVEDTGIGIAPGEQARIFESFRQADSSTTRRFGGTGLGTAIARELTYLMGGEIGLQSVPGRGSLFWVQLPFQSPEQPDGRMPGLDDLRALIVAGEAAGDALANCLAAWGLEYRRVGSSVDAFAALSEAERSEKPFGVVLVCADSLDTDVGQFAKTMGRASRLCETGLVLINAPRSARPRDHWYELGYSAALPAPLDKTLLFNAIHAVRCTQEVPGNVVSLVERYRRLASPIESGLSVLVAEDNETNRLVLQRLLERIGHSVTHVSDGEAALDILADPSRSFDLMILDHNMPGRSGLEVYKAHRFIDPGHPLPTIILTADATPEAQAACRKVGVDAYLTKPVETSKLMETIATLMQRSAKSGQEHPRLAAGRPAEGAARDEEILDEAKLEALDLMGAGPEFLDELIEGFLSDSEGSIAKMAGAVAKGDYAAMREAIHALKGGAAELGAVRLLRVCGELRALKPFELGGDKAAALLEDLQLTYRETARLLEEFAVRAREG
jgi:two-component system sensor histidine kinase RpfC